MRWIAWIATAAFVAILAALIFEMFGVDVGPWPHSIAGILAIALGTLLSLAVGFGLMGLMFYSNRHGIDDRNWRAADGARRDGSGGQTDHAARGK